MEGCRRRACALLRGPPSLKPSGRHPEWVGPNSSRQPPFPNSPARGTATARALVSGFRARSGLPELRDPPAATAHPQPHSVTVMGTAPCVCNLWIPIRSVQRQAVPNLCLSGLRVAGLVAPPGSPPRRLGSGRFV